MNAFAAWAVGAFVLLIVFAGIIGGITRRNLLGILVDGRGRYSLTHLQVVMWTLVVLATLIGALAASKLRTAALAIPPEVLGLIGISAGRPVNPEWGLAAA